MKTKLIAIIVALLLPMEMWSQTYNQLWKLVDDAQQKDLPQTAITHLTKIEKKAKAERSYGHLLKATLLHARCQAEIAPDSLQPAVARLEQLAAEAGDAALSAVYATVLTRLYSDQTELGDDRETKAAAYRTQALAHPEILIQTKSSSYIPFVIEGDDSELFGRDLLSVIGYELEAWQWMHDAYEQAGNRRAACLMALNMLRSQPHPGYERLAESHYIQQLDSLLQHYGDLAEAGEVAIERYAYMGNTDATPADKAAFLDIALQQWGSWRRMNQLRNWRAALVAPRFTMWVPEQGALPGQTQQVKLTELRNVSSVTLRVYRTQLSGDTQLNLNDDRDYRKIKASLKEVVEARQTCSFTGYEPYELFEDSLTLAALPVGVYMLEATSQPSSVVSRALYYVTGLRVMALGLPDNRKRYVVVDAATGQPVSNAKISIRQSRYGREEQPVVKSVSADGEATYGFKRAQWHSVYAYTDNDRACPLLYTSNGYYTHDDNHLRTYTHIFTDRAIYRPGQTVRMAGIVYELSNYVETKTVAGRQLTATLRDANYKVVAEQQVTTDAYGKCTADFQLPAGLKNGRFSIRLNGASHDFRVEEYKRPTFSVAMQPYEAAYAIGDTIVVKGKAQSYAGVPVQGARVRYTVRRQLAFWWMTYCWRRYGGSMGVSRQGEELYSAEVLTGDDGTFETTVPLLVREEDKGRPTFYTYAIEADVTDVAGETYHGELSLPLGTKSTALTCDVPQQVRADQIQPVTFARHNAAGQPIAGTVRYRIDGGRWQTCAANEPVQLLPEGCRSGEKRLEAVCEQDSIDVRFVVFGLDDTKPATATKDWFYVSHSQFPNDGSAVTVQVGSSDPALHIAYCISTGKQVIEEGIIRENSSLWNRKFTYQDSYSGGLSLAFAWVKDGKSYQHTATITRPVPDKKLKLNWVTFRDRLQPGQQEEWQLQVNNPDGTPADAQLMAVLYDKSLDQLTPHSWKLTPATSIPTTRASWSTQGFGSLSIGGEQPYTSLQVPSLQLSRFDQSCYPVYFMRYVAFGRPMMRMAKSNAVMMDADMAVMETASASAKEMKAEEPVVVGYGVSGNADEEESAVTKGTDDTAAELVQVRENLQETAFFYPTLQTDSTGRVAIRFTLPESLTTWRFMGIANTTGMLTGNLEGETVAQKDVMVQPNVPRFIRMGDMAQLSARIFNNSDNEKRGKATLTLVDPETEKTVYEEQIGFVVASGQTTVVSFRFSPNEQTPSLLVCKVVASGDGFSDGEQHYLPVLPDRERVTVTVPITQHDAGVCEVRLSQFFPKETTQQKLTIEYTNNPAWLMVQSLATLGRPHETSAIDQAAAYYSNLLAQTILAQSPQAKATFELWNREEGEKTSLQSALTKNETLKDIVLAETPWVAEAEREAEQKRLLGEFFEENTISNRLQTALDKLQALQQSSGAFSWYPGMLPSTHITMAVGELLARLNTMTGGYGDAATIQTRALDYLGKEMVEMVNEMKKQERRGIKPTFPSFIALRWLYICAIDGRALPSGIKAANEYLIALLKKEIKRQSIYEKALTAVVLHQHGETAKAQQYVRSLKEYSVYTEEMGRYYDTPRAGYSWYSYKIPTEVAAIEAIKRVQPQDEQTIDEMRRWLLQEKRTQLWDTPISSVNAIYAFLFDQAQLLATQEPVAIAIDGKAVDLPKSTAGIGYVKTSVSKPTGQLLTFDKKSDGTSWGAVYAQFMQQISAVESAASGISVKREILDSDSKAIKTGTLSVGDRIKVRITIETSRNLDFVQVLDRRAACMEPVKQLSGYQQGAYCSPKDFSTNYYYNGLPKGRHVIETEYYIDRPGVYETGTCSVQCAYSPEYRATAPSQTIKVNE